MAHGTPHLTSLFLKSIPWTLAEFRHNRIVTYLDNIRKMRFLEDDDLRFLRRKHVNILFKLQNQIYRVYENLIVFLVVTNNKTIHAPTSKDCYIY